MSTVTRAFTPILLATSAALAALSACGEGTTRTTEGSPPPQASSSVPSLPPPPPPPAPPFLTDASTDTGTFVACASSAVEAKREPLPVDIIWVVDNSASMAPAVAEVQAGLNAFANLVGTKGLDFKVVMLSLRGSSPTVIGGQTLYPVCIPPPLGGADCGNGPRFFHASLNVLSTQILEQFLGTLDQTTGYASGASRGSVPWAQELRPSATKSIVVASDDNSRFPARSFEMFPGGPSPYTNGLTLPVGLLHPSRTPSWKGYLFHGIYGWGSTLDDSIRCVYPDNSKPSTSGAEYSSLVAKTGGVRAQICDGSAAWGPFFDAVATAVIATARVACELPLPVPDGGVLDPTLVNVRVTDGLKPPLTVPNVANQAACGLAEGWYYEAATPPTKVFLCPVSCENAQSRGPGVNIPKVEVLLGCKTVAR